ncbi:MAG: hypothetical protein HY903_06685 [Deltaproteobacteria bacterium]|nr:hypothetical protein [Deltaproteobacteria bacterium]
MKTTMLSSVCVVLVSACGVEHGTSLQLVRIAKPSGACTTDPEPQAALARGFFDPRGFINAGPAFSYSLAPNIRNNMSPAVADAAVSFSPTNRRPDGNDVLLHGFDICWFRADAEGGSPEAMRYGAWEDGPPDSLKCDNLPASQRAFIPATGQVPANSGQLSLFVDVLDLAAMRTMYGSGFDPSALPARGLNATTGTYFYGTADAPSAAPRNAAWGTYPHENVATVVLQIQALGKLQAGTSVKSNWLVHPIDVCVGCLADACGLLTIDASVACAVGTTGVSGLAMAPITSCLPFQDVQLNCTQYSTCVR